MAGLYRSKDVQKSSLKIAPPIRRMWTIYKSILAKSGAYRRRDLVVAQEAFYAGARSVYEIISCMIEDGEWEELKHVVERQVAQSKALRSVKPRATRH